MGKVDADPEDHAGRKYQGEGEDLDGYMDP